MATDREAQSLKAAYEAGITSPRELANFMAQVSAESNGLNRLNEGFRYTKGPDAVTASVKSAGREGPQALKAAWQEAMDGRPQGLAELMYGGRMGNNEPGDGYKYHGRGYIQLTGKNQYRDAGEALDLDLINKPELAAEPGNAARIAVWYWKENVQALAPQNVKEAGSIINTGELGNTPNGLKHREAEFARWERALTPEMMRNLAAGKLGETVTTPQESKQSAPTYAHQGDFNDVMRTMLPPQNGVAPHMTSAYGPRTLYGRPDHHGGVDFNYRGGQAGMNLQHPTVRSPVSGEVVFSGGQYGTVKIRDAQGNMHEILHMDSRSVQVTNPPTRVQAGDPIGTMGNTNPDNPRLAQHVHYQIRDSNGRTVDPERFWNNRAIEGPTQPGAELRTQRSGAMADGLLKQGERGPEVVAAQEALNRLGYTGRDGRPLETRSGIYGAETRHAVEDFQRRHGLKADGVIGDDTRTALATAAQRPLLSEATHPNHRLYAHFGRELPAGTPPAAVANVTLQALENGISRPDQIRGIGVRGSDVVIARQGVDPGDRIQVDLGAPTATIQQMSDHTRRQSLQPAEPRSSHRVQPDVQEPAPRAVSI